MQHRFPAGKAYHGLLILHRPERPLNIFDRQGLSAVSAVAAAMHAVQIAAICQFEKQVL